MRQCCCDRQPIAFDVPGRTTKRAFSADSSGPGRHVSDRNLSNLHNAIALLTAGRGGPATTRAAWVYRLVAMLLRTPLTFDPTLVRAEIATRAIRAAIRAYSIRSWPDSSFMNFVISCFIVSVLLKGSAVRTLMRTPCPTCVVCDYLALEGRERAMTIKC